jgi:hypothetical protein
VAAVMMGGRVAAVLMSGGVGDELLPNAFSS